MEKLLVSLFYNFKQYQLLGSFIAKVLGYFASVQLLNFVRTLHDFVQIIVEIFVTRSYNVEVVQSKDIPGRIKILIYFKLLKHSFQIVQFKQCTSFLKILRQFSLDPLTLISLMQLKKHQSNHHGRQLSIRGKLGINDTNNKQSIIEKKQ